MLILALLVVLSQAIFLPRSFTNKRSSWLAPVDQSNLLGCNYQCSGAAPGAITNIADLRPCDVKVVAALGDSITAAFAASGSIWEYRESSFFIGMGKNSTTTANFLKQVNPAVIGGPTVGHLPEVAGEGHDALQDILSAAQSEAKIADLLPGGRGPQIPYMISEMQELNNLGYMSLKNDWKIVNIWIGANDLCEVCKDMQPDAPHGAIYFANLLNQTLTMIHANIPKTFVNLIPFFGLGQIYNLTRPYIWCDTVHSVFSECACMFSQEEIDRQNMDLVGTQYNTKMKDLSAWWNSQGISDFAVVVQPGNIGFKVPDISFVSTLDCFHPSLEAHEMLGVGLWNQMLQPMSQKTSPWVLPQTPVCPVNDAKFFSN